MISSLRGGWDGSQGAGLAVCLLATVTALAQTPTPGRVVLNSRRASHLILSQVKPQYPPLAKHNYIQGQVRLQVVVSPDGRVSETHVVRGHPLLAAAALQAVCRWRYQPFERGGRPTEFLTVVDVNFSLHTKKIEELPRRPDQDLNRQVRPPEVLGKSGGNDRAPSVRLRVLVSDAGKVMDSQPIGGLPTYFEAAREKVKSWTFRPAYWGNLAVPWYVDVEVPVEVLPAPRPAGDPGGR